MYKAFASNKMSAARNKPEKRIRSRHTKPSWQTPIDRGSGNLYTDCYKTSTTAHSFSKLINNQTSKHIVNCKNHVYSNMTAATAQRLSWYSTAKKTFNLLISNKVVICYKITVVFNAKI